MLRIEAATIHDLPGAYRTCLLTGDSGRDASALYRDPDLLGHVYVGPYIARGVGTQLIVVNDTGTVGYLVSADDTLEFETWAEAAWWPQLRDRYPRLDGASPDTALVRLIHEPERTPPELAQGYPAHLHVDLQERAQGRGLGRVLVERVISEMRERGVPGLHLGVAIANPSAIAFYEHLGFCEVGREPGGLLLGQRLRR